MSDKFEGNNKKKVIYDCKVIRNMNLPNNTEENEGDKKKRKQGHIVFCVFLAVIIATVISIPYLIKIPGFFDKKNDKVCFSSESISADSSPVDIGISEENSGRSISPAEIYEKNKQSVVRIVVSQDSDDSYPYGFGDFSEFFGGGAKQALGSGMIIRSDGYILTNAHVVDIGGKKTKIYVSFDDNDTKRDNDDLKNGEEAELIGMDKTTDLAVIKVKKTGLTPVAFGNSDKIKIGGFVCAMGCPLGMDKSITQGIISGSNRRISQDIWSTTYIQTDAAINPGNSGGPLFDDLGRVIGVNTIKIVESAAEGLGFAIPSNDAVHIAKQLIEKGYFSRPMLGVSIENRLGRVEIMSIDSRSDLRNFAEKGDEILAINGKNVTSSQDLVSEIKGYQIGDKVNVRIEKRATGEKRDIPVTLFDANKK